MDLIYFIKDISLRIEKEYHLKDDYQFLYSILPDSIKNKNLNLNSKVCPFIIKSGVRRFLPCNHPVNSNSEFCEKHTTYNFKKEHPKEFKEIEKEKQKLLLLEESKKPKISIIAQKQIQQQNSIILVKNKFNNILWPNSTLVFKSFKEKIIIGTEDINGNVVPLNENDIQLCINYKLKYISSVLIE
jgi:hypothetical protein